MVDVTSPVPANTVVGVLIGGKLYGLNLLSDTAGADAMGVVTANPDANTLLGRLKAIVTSLTAGPKTGAASLSIVPASDAGMATSAKQDALLAASTVTLPPFTITPHATNALERPISGLAVTVAGTVIFKHPADTVDRTITLQPGFYPVGGITHIRTGGTATGMTGF